MAKTLIGYHANCPDGFAAAWVAWREWGPRAEYVPCQYGQPPLEIATDTKTVYLVDFSYPPEVLDKLLTQHPDVIFYIFDHHKTAIEKLEGYRRLRVNLRLDNGYCGAVLTWKYFYPDKEIPFILRYVQDRDLWQWKLPGSKEINEWLSLVPRLASKENFEAFNHTKERLETSGWRADAALDGQLLLKYKQNQIDSAVRRAREFTLLGRKLLVVNSTVNFSEVAGELAEAPGIDIGCCWFQRDDGRFQYSLRSCGDVSARDLAQELGGGGHDKAAGFESKKLLFGQASWWQRLRERIGL